MISILFSIFLSIFSHNMIFASSESTATIHPGDGISVYDGSLESRASDLENQNVHAVLPTRAAEEESAVHVGARGRGKGACNAATGTCVLAGFLWGILDPENFIPWTMATTGLINSCVLAGSSETKYARCVDFRYFDM